jgi:hypothetical protein
MQSFRDRVAVAAGGGSGLDPLRRRFGCLERAIRK